MELTDALALASAQNSLLTVRAAVIAQLRRDGKYALANEMQAQQDREENDWNNIIEMARKAANV